MRIHGKIKSFKEILQTPIQMLLRGQTYAYKNYPDDVVTKFVENLMKMVLIFSESSML